MDHLISRLSVSCTKRVQGCIVTLPDSKSGSLSKLLWINSYLSSDPGNRGHYDETELRKTLAGVRELIEKNAHDNILWQSDLNVDFGRKPRQVDILSDFIENLGLENAWSKFGIDFTYSNPDNTAFSTIDHTLFNKNLNTNIMNGGVRHIGSNLSGHSPIFVELATGHLPQREETEHSHSSQQNWKNASENDKLAFRTDVRDRLNKINIPESLHNCTDIHCKDPDHRKNLDKYVIDIIESVEEATQKNIPYTNSKKNNASKRKVIPGWTELVEPYKQEAQFHYSVWL